MITDWHECKALKNEHVFVVSVDRRWWLVLLVPLVSMWQTSALRPRAPLPQLPFDHWQQPTGRSAVTSRSVLTRVRSHTDFCLTLTASLCGSEVYMCCSINCNSACACVYWFSFLLGGLHFWTETLAGYLIRFLLVLWFVLDIRWL